MAPTCDSNFAFLQLTRGGICIRREGVNDPADPAYLNVQIGSPPETLKDTLNNPHWPVGVPRDFIVPERLIDPRAIVTLAELEFTGYYHYFERPEKQNTRIFLNNPDMEEHVRNMLNEAVFGPRIPFDEFKQDFAIAEEAFDISKECEFFNPFSFEDVFRIFTRKPEDKRLAISDRYELAVLRNNGIFFYKLYEKGNAAPIFSCSEIDLFSRKKTLQRKNSSMARPDFAISSIGNSTGFDEKGETSGFVIWVNGRGILIDPPANTRFWMKEYDVLPEETDRVILTHCHADHDAGLLQRILENDHLDIYTTRTVWNSFIRKYGKLVEELQPSYRWHEVKIGETMNIEGAAFKFFYSLHSVPTIAFTVRHKDINVFYSSDMRFSPKTYEAMRQAGKIDESRYEYFTRQHISLMHEADFILHEAGGDPLHTTMEELDALDLSIKRKTFVYHLPEELYEKKRKDGLNDFTLITTGMDKHQIKVFSDEEQVPAQPDDTFLKYCPLFHEMKLRDIQKIQQHCHIRRIPRGAVVFKKDAMPSQASEDIDGFVYLVYSGMAGIVNGTGKKIKDYHKFDFIGETAVLLNRPRNADVVALDDMVCYGIPNADFREIMLPYSSLFQRLEANRGLQVEEALLGSYFTAGVSWRARTDLQLNGQLKTYKKGDEIMNGGNERFLLVVAGKVRVKKGDLNLDYPVSASSKLRIDHVGDPNNQGTWNLDSAVALEDDTRVLEVGKDDYINFCSRHGTFRWHWRYLKTYFPDYCIR